MTAICQQSDSDHATRRRAIARVLVPFVNGTAEGMSSSVMTEARVALTARDAADAILPLLGTPSRSAHRVRRTILPALVCSWSELDAVFEEVLDALLALPPALPDVADPTWDVDVEAAEPRGERDGDWNVHGSTWTPTAVDEEVVGPSGTKGRLVRSDRQQDPDPPEPRVVGALAGDQHGQLLSHRVAGVEGHRGLGGRSPPPPDIQILP